eukprot:scaffold20274_cov23-Cyclotella_meneghiniana.AAC.1
MVEANNASAVREYLGVELLFLPLVSHDSSCIVDREYLLGSYLCLARDEWESSGRVVTGPRHLLWGLVFPDPPLAPRLFLEVEGGPLAFGVLCCGRDSPPPDSRSTWHFNHGHQQDA